MPSRIEEPDAGNKIPTKPLSSFALLAPKVSLYEPAKSSIAASPLAPTTILFCSWMNAVPKHIEYYTRTYMQLFPSARIILVTINTNEFLFQTETRRRADVQAAVTAILAPDQKNERLFVHSLSNGGARRVYGILGAYRTLTGHTLPVKAWLLDSAPGIPKFRRDIHALQFPARNWSWFIWLPYMAVVLSTVSVVYVVINWMPKWVWHELVWGPIDGMSDVNLLRRDCVKGFIYSKEDLSIDWKDVEKYAAIAKGKGYQVTKKMIHGAGHVQLFKGKGGEKDYWGFVERLWNGSAQDLELTP